MKEDLAQSANPLQGLTRDQLAVLAKMAADTLSGSGLSSIYDADLDRRRKDAKRRQELEAALAQLDLPSSDDEVESIRLEMSKHQQAIAELGEKLYRTEQAKQSRRSTIKAEICGIRHWLFARAEQIVVKVFDHRIGAEMKKIADLKGQALNAVSIPSLHPAPGQRFTESDVEYVKQHSNKAYSQKVDSITSMFTSREKALVALRRALFDRATNGESVSEMEQFFADQLADLPPLTAN